MALVGRGWRRKFPRGGVLAALPFDHPPTPLLSMRLPFILRSAPYVFLALALSGRSAWGQEAGPHTLEPGDTVRVSAPALHEGVIQGELLRYHGDSLAVREWSTGTAYQFPLGTIRRLEKNEGRDRRRSVRHWALAGLFIGAATGLVSGPLIATADEGGGMAGPTLVAGIGGGALGFGMGAAGGALFSADRWQRFRMPVPPPTPQTPHLDAPG